MASFQQRKNKGKTSYTVKVRLKGHKPVFATFERLTDARKWATQTEAAIREGRYFKTIEAQRHTLGDLVDRYVSDVFPQKPKIAKEYARHLEWWKLQLGHITLADITPAEMSELRDQLANGTAKWGTKKGLKEGLKRSPATVNRYLAALSSAFGTAVKEWGWLEENPMRRISKLKEPRGRVRYLSEEERKQLLHACKKSKNKDLYKVVVLALSTGARQMEIWGLKWSEVDLDRGWITLRNTKNQEIRTIPLEGEALNLLKEHAKIPRLNTDLVFPSRKNPRFPHDFRDPWDKALKEAGIAYFRWHDLRHSAASYLAMNGVPIRTIAEILGHKSLQMVQRYTHLSPDHLKEAVASMNKQIFD